MQQQDVEQWIAQHGGAGQVQYSQALVEVPNPAADVAAAKAAGVTFNPMAPDKLRVRQEKWEGVDAEGKPTGAVLHVQHKDDGSFDVLQQSDANPTRPQTGQVTGPEGTPTGQVDAQGQPIYDNENPRMVTRGPNGQITKADPLTAEQRKQWDEDRQKSRNPGGLTDAALQARAPQVVPGTLNTTSPQVGAINPTTGQVTWTPNPNYQKEKPEPFAAPANQRWVIWRNADGSTTTEKNPNYRPPSQLQLGKDGRWEEITQDENGKPIIRPVTRETTIKPADLPVLQAQYGQIASGLGSLLADLNKQVAAGTMTPEERDQAFTAAHQQADTQVSEINSILSNSRATWAQDVAQQQQTFGEAASRRSFASGLVQNAFTTGANLAESSGPGHGQAIAQGMAAMLDIGQKYAAGMGGFPSMEPVAAPRAVQQARDIGIPGFGDQAPPPGPAGAPGPGALAAPPAAPPAGAPAPAPVFRPPPPISAAPVGAATPAPPFQPTPYPGLSPAAVQAATDTTGRLIQGAIGASGSPPPVSGPTSRTDDTYPGMVQQLYTGQPANPQTMPHTGQNPGMQLMGQLGNRFGTTTSPIGLPAAIGGSGYFDLGQVAQGMLGDGSDPAWAEAVRQAYAAINQPRPQPGVMY